jgi:hypothetical protein
MDGRNLSLSVTWAYTKREKTNKRKEKIKATMIAGSTMCVVCPTTTTISVELPVEINLLMN